MGPSFSAASNCSLMWSARLSSSIGSSALYLAASSSSFSNPYAAGALTATWGSSKSMAHTSPDPTGPYTAVWSSKVSPMPSMKRVETRDPSGR